MKLPLLLKLAYIAMTCASFVVAFSGYKSQASTQYSQIFPITPCNVVEYNCPICSNAVLGQATRKLENPPTNYVPSSYTGGSYRQTGTTLVDCYLRADCVKGTEYKGAFCDFTAGCKVSSNANDTCVTLTPGLFYTVQDFIYVWEQVPQARSL